MPKIVRIKNQDIVEKPDPDVQVICRKHGIGRHDLIHLATIVAKVRKSHPN